MAVRLPAAEMLIWAEPDVRHRQITVEELDQSERTSQAPVRHRLRRVHLDDGPTISGRNCYGRYRAATASAATSPSACSRCRRPRSRAAETLAAVADSRHAPKPQDQPRRCPLQPAGRLQMNGLRPSFATTNWKCSASSRTADVSSVRGTPGRCLRSTNCCSNCSMAARRRICPFDKP